MFRQNLPPGANPNGWVLCSSKTFPGKYYYFNVNTGEAAWTLSENDKTKFIRKDYNIPKEPFKYHSYPEPRSPPMECQSPKVYSTFPVRQTPEYNFQRITPPIFGQIYAKHQPMFGQNTFQRYIPTNFFSSTQNSFGNYVQTRPMFEKSNSMFRSNSVQMKPEFETKSNGTFQKEDQIHITATSQTLSKRFLRMQLERKMINERLRKRLNTGMQTEPEIVNKKPKLNQSLKGFKIPLKVLTKEKVSMSKSVQTSILDPNESNGNHKIKQSENITRNDKLNSNDKSVSHSDDCNDKLVTSKPHKSVKSIFSPVQTHQEINGNKPENGNEELSKLHQDDLRLFLMAKKKLIDDVIEKKGCNTKTVNTKIVTEPATPKKKVTFDFTNITEEPILYDEGVPKDMDENDYQVEIDVIENNNVSNPEEIIPRSDTVKTLWYIVTDFDSLIEDFDAIVSVIEADTTCHLLLPGTVKAALDELSLGDCRGREKVQLARGISRRIARMRDKIFVLDDKDIKSTNESADPVINACIHKMNNGYHVVLLTSDQLITAEAVMRNVAHLSVSYVKTVQSQLKVKFEKKNDISLKKNESTDMNMIERLRIDDDTNTKSNIENVPIKIKQDVLSKNKSIPEGSLKKNSNEGSIKKSTSEVIFEQNTNEIIKKISLEGVMKKNVMKDSLQMFTNEGTLEKNTNESIKKLALEGRIKKMVMEETLKKTTNVSKINKSTHDISMKITNEGSLIKTNKIKNSANQDDNMKKIAKEKPSEEGSLQNYAKEKVKKSPISMKNVANEGTLKKFAIKNSVMAERLTLRKDEWLCCYVQTMEDALTHVLMKQQLETTKHPSPWTMYEALDCLTLVKYQDDGRIEDAILKLIYSLPNILEFNNTIKSDIKPCEFMKIFGLGTQLIERLKAIPDYSYLENAQNQLETLLKNIQDPTTDPDVDFDVKSQSGDSKSRVSDVITQSSQSKSNVSETASENDDVENTKVHENPTSKIETYLNHFVNLRESDEPKSMELEPVTVEESAEICPTAQKYQIEGIKIVRTIGRELRNIKINNTRELTDDSEKDVIYNGNDAIYKGNDVIDNVYDTGNTFLTDKHNEIAPKVLRNISIIKEYEERIKKSNNNKIVNDTSESPTANTDVIDDTTDSGIVNSNENNHAETMVKAFFTEIKTNFCKIYNFIKTSTKSVQNGRLNEEARRKMQKKSQLSQEHITSTIDTLQRIANRESSDSPYTLKSMLVNAGINTDDIRLSGYRKVILKCLEQAKVLKEALNMLSKIIYDDLEGLPNLLSNCNFERPSCEIGYYNMFE